MDEFEIFDDYEREIERLKAALAQSCDENRHVVIAEGAWSTDMCPLGWKLQEEIERLRAVVDVLEAFLDGDIGYEPLEEALAALKEADDE